jgi:hypothetical protein
VSTTAATGAVTEPDATLVAGRSEGGAPRRPRRESLATLTAYMVLSILLFGLPVLGHFSSRIIAADAIDSSAFLWFFAWWPHAIFHGLNPFVTHVMFVPDGFNLTWGTSMPGPSLLMTPVTELFGPAATWNVIQLASPALSAWTAYLLCRHVTGRRWPSLVGGYVYGFSPYMLVHLTGGPYLALVPLLPVLVLLVLKRTEGSIGPRRFVVATAAALTGQFLISSEVLLTATLFGGISLVLAFALLPERRRPLLDVAKLLILAYAATAVLISPFLYFFLFGHHYPPGATYFTADVAGFALPPPLVALSRQHPAFAGANTETYLGLPLIALILAFMWQGRRSRVAWVIGLSLAAAALLSLGGHLWVRGHLTSFPLPWYEIGRLPLLRYAITLRFAVFVALPAALIVALWCSRDGTAPALRWGLAAVAVLFIVPEVGSSSWKTNVQDPAFFASGAYRNYVKPADHVLTVPVWGPNERWQANTGFRFKLADGYLGNPFPPSYSRYPAWNMLLNGQLTPHYAADLKQFIAAKGVTAIVVDRTVPGPWTRLFATLGVRPVQTGGVLFYRLKPTGARGAA